MVVVFRALGLKVNIYTDDHLPAHVHVTGDGEAKINLAPPGGEPQMLWAVGFKRSDIRRAMRIVIEQNTMLIEHWSEIHEGND
jgi:subtilisin-like proprotein convertase family protein